MARAMGGGPSGENSKDNERSARQAGGRAAGKCLVGQQPSEPGGALDERGAH